MTTRIPMAAEHLKEFDVFGDISPEISEEEAALRNAAALRREIDDLIHERAYLAHSHGMSWEQIASVLGITRQSASANFRLPPRSMQG